MIGTTNPRHTLCNDCALRPVLRGGTFGGIRKLEICKECGTRVAGFPNAIDELYRMITGRWPWENTEDTDS